MDSQVLRKIQMDIRNNFGKYVDWSSVPKETFNCYMFALSNTIATEVFSHCEDGEIHLQSVIDENVVYFGDIGQISGKSNYSNKSELIDALKSDLEILGIIATESLDNDILTDKYVKIAFYYDTDTLLKGKHSNFHFIRQDGNKCVHKMGWIGDVEELKCSIEEISVEGLELIGIFKLRLKESIS